MGSPQPLVLALIALNGLVTAWGFRSERIFERWVFSVRAMQQGRVLRLLSSGFLHVSWSHYFFNMVTLYFFAGATIDRLGSAHFLYLYLLSLVAGNLLALLIHRRHKNYRAVGASGAVSGVVYAAIALYPDMQLALIFLPIPFPAWIYGIAFIVYSLYGIGKQSDNIGHEAHLGGAVAGLLYTIALRPELAQSNPLTILYILVPAVVFLVVMIVRPRLVAMAFGNRLSNAGVEDRYREQRAFRESEMNRILEKIQTQGRASLSKEEQDFLRRQSGRDDHAHRAGN